MLATFCLLRFETFCGVSIHHLAALVKKIAKLKKKWGTPYSLVNTQIAQGHWDWDGIRFWILCQHQVSQTGTGNFWNLPISHLKEKIRYQSNSSEYLEHLSATPNFFF